MLLKKKLHPILHVIFRVQNEYLTKGQKGTKSREEKWQNSYFHMNLWFMPCLESVEVVLQCQLYYL